jgi:hypothetical protein
MGVQVGDAPRRELDDVAAHQVWGGWVERQRRAQQRVGRALVDELKGEDGREAPFVS